MPTTPKVVTFAVPFDLAKRVHGMMRDLRAQSTGRSLLVFYAFDPRRSVILLIRGDKTGKDRFYEQFVPMADRPYYEHLEQLKKEGLIE